MTEPTTPTHAARVRQVPFIDLAAQRDRVRSELDAAIATVLDHGQYINGPEVRDLEARLADRVAAPHVVACSSGTDALVLPLLAWDVGRGDAVLVPTFTFAATAEAVALLGATPVFVDVDSATFTMDPTSLERGIATATNLGLRPRVVIPVDLFGHPADYEPIEALAEHHGLLILADAAQSFGAMTGGRPVGSIGDCTATSFFPAKPLGCYGDGGAVFVADPDLAARIRSCRVHGQGRNKYENVRIGMNGRLDTIQAAVLLVKLSIFDDELEARSRIAARYCAALEDAVSVPAVRHGDSSAWAQFTIRTSDRDRVAARLADDGIPTVVYYPTPLHHQPAYVHYPVADGGCPVAESLASTVLSLPFHPYLDPRAQDRVCEAVRRATGG